MVMLENEIVHADKPLPRPEGDQDPGDLGLEGNDLIRPKRKGDLPAEAVRDLSRRFPGGLKTKNRITGHSKREQY
jgi:hypothetical protein